MYRCREGRLSYLGVVSFVLIALTMSCVLLNAPLGDAIVDHILPFVYSGLMMLGAKLYDVSITALLLPLLLTFTVVNYIAFVYHPVSRSYSRRVMAMRKLQLDDSTFNRSLSRKMSGSRNQPNDHMRRFPILIRLKHTFQYVVATFSDRRIRSYKAKKNRITRTWCSMNMASSSLGVILKPGEKEYCVKKESNNWMTASTRSQMFSFKNSSYRPPHQIALMMPSVRNLKRNFTNEQHGDPKSLLSGSLKDERILIKSELPPNASKTLYALIVFDTQDALKRMRCQLTDESFADDDAYLHVSVHDLCEQFVNIFDFFYPDGIIMSSVERIEAYELFNEWVGEQSFYSKEIDDGTCTYFIITISFALFEKWFSESLMELIHNTMRDRLVAHTTRNAPTVNMRDVSMKSTKQQEDGRLRSSKSFYGGGDMSMKSLNIVTLESLFIPRCSYEENRSSGNTSPTLSFHRNYSRNEIPFVSEFVKSSLGKEREKEKGQSSISSPRDYTDQRNRVDIIFPDSDEDVSTLLYELYPVRDAIVVTTEEDLRLLQQLRSQSSSRDTPSPRIETRTPARTTILPSGRVVDARTPLDPNRSSNYMSPIVAGQYATLNDFLSRRYLNLCGSILDSHSTDVEEKKDEEGHNYLFQSHWSSHN